MDDCSDNDLIYDDPISPCRGDSSTLIPDLENDWSTSTSVTSSIDESSSDESQPPPDSPNASLASLSSPSASRKSKAEMIMSESDWQAAIALALGELRTTKVEITSEAFTVESKTHRYTLKKLDLLKSFLIFPWFHADGRFRQTLKPPDSTIEEVIHAVNFFSRKCGSYTPEENQFFSRYYTSMKIPVLSRCFTTIVDLQSQFLRLQRTETPVDLCTLVIDHDHQINELEERMDRLEVSLTADIPGAKRVRKGGDRACFYPIRRVDLATRDQWCVPGAVLGLYGDGVGRLLPLGAGYRRSIVVYSTDPDTEEEHPNPNHRDLYVRVVMVGEAPVTLRFDQYDKLKAWACICDLYINHFGDICIRRFERDPPHGGTIFAQTSWSKEYAVDEKGYPVFQGTQGVCAKIFSPSPPVNENTRIARLFHKSTHAIKSLFIKPKDEMSLLELMAKRQELFVNLSKIKAKHRDYKACLEQCNQLRSEMANHGPSSSSSPVDEEQGRNTTANLKELESRMCTLMDHETFEREKAPLQTELNRMKVLIKEYVKTHQHEFS